VKVNDVVIKDTFYRVPLDEADISVVLQGKIEYIKIDLVLEGLQAKEEGG
jgi:hypothetical protein